MNRAEQKQAELAKECPNLYAQVGALKELPFNDALTLTKYHVAEYNDRRNNDKKDSPPVNWESVFHYLLLDTPERKAALCSYNREFAHQVFSNQSDEAGIKALIKASFPNDPWRFRALVLENHLEIVPYIKLLNLPVRDLCHFVHEGGADLKSKLDELQRIYVRQNYAVSDNDLAFFANHDPSASKRLRQLELLMDESHDEEEYRELCNEYDELQQRSWGSNWVCQTEVDQRQELSDRFIPSRMTHLTWYRFKDLLPILEESSFALIERKYKSNTLKVNAKIAAHMPAEKNDMCVILTPSQSGSSLKSPKNPAQ